VQSITAAFQYGIDKSDIRFLRYLGLGLVDNGDFVDGFVVLFHLVKEQPTSDLAWAFLGYAHMRVGRWRDALTCLDEADARQRGGAARQSCRLECLVAVGDLGTAEALLSELLADTPQSVTELALGVQISLLRGDREGARQRLAALMRREDGDDWDFYLEALVCLAFKEADEAKRACERAIAIAAREDAPARTSRSTSNEALVHVLLGDFERANALYGKLFERRDFQHLWRFSLPELRTLIRLGHGGTVASDFFESLRERVRALTPPLPDRDRSNELWQDYLARFAPAKTATPQASELPVQPSSGTYRFPMYCRLSGIAGLGVQRDFAAALLARNDSIERTIILLELEPNDRVYGQCNFKLDPDDFASYKFCDTASTIVEANLASFYEDYGVRLLLFIAAGLYERVAGYVRLRGWDMECRLIDAAASH
jgi:tetratricopeptide (TPR) repeat protein